jgi:glycosyltransferase involved in cell wall biosynthesis
MRRALQLKAAVRFLGVVSGGDKHALLQAADTFALPSRQLPSGRSEGLPCALLEALAAGLPIAASQLPGIEPLLAEHAPRHVLVPPDDPDALRAAWLALREDPASRRARNPSRQAVIAHYGWPSVGERLSALLEGVELRS